MADSPADAIDRVRAYLHARTGMGGLGDIIHGAHTPRGEAALTLSDLRALVALVDAPEREPVQARGPVIAKHAWLNARTGVFILDGHPFPWHITDSVQIDRERSRPALVTVSIMVDNVTLVDEPDNRSAPIKGTDAPS